MDTQTQKHLNDLLAVKGLAYLRYEHSTFGWSVAATVVDSKRGIICHLSSTDGEVTVVGLDYIDTDSGATYSEFETLADAIKFFQSAIDKS